MQTQRSQTLFPQSPVLVSLLHLLASGTHRFLILASIASQIHAVTPNEGIEMRPFAQPQHRSSATPLFEKLHSEITGIDFRMEFPEVGVRFRELLQLGALGGICTGDYDGDGWCDIYISSPQGSGRLFRNQGNFRFEDVTRQTGLFAPEFWGTGASFVDIDNDGDLDLAACGYRQPNRIYLNSGSQSGSVSFKDQAPSLGLNYEGGSMTMAFADMDRDGDLDVYLATTAVPPPANEKFRVRFEGKKPVVPEELREYWGLLYLPGDQAYPTENGQYDHLYRNDNGVFTEVTKPSGIDGPHLTLAAIWWDFDSDGWPDIYVANDYMGPDKLYHNQGDGTFRDLAQTSLPHTPWSSMGVDFGDLNNDGCVDGKDLATLLAAWTGCS